MRRFARLMRKHCIKSKHGADDPNPMLKDEKQFTGQAAAAGAGAGGAAAPATNYMAADLTLNPLEFTAACKEITRATAQTSVACKVKMFQDTNEKVLQIDWTTPTVAPQPGLETTKDTQKRWL